MASFISIDIVFYAGSLNYDQGSGNYQELKKITKWDGKQYTFVSRYALRYSLLETARKLGFWKVAEGEKLKAEGKAEPKVIQPAEDLLYSGEILEYPEFDLFGYLITSITPQNFREAPVKISHAISMSPFNYDALFNANIGLANRMRKKYGEMKPNPFTAEEHMTYYQYSILVDIDRIGEIEVYKQLKGDDKKDLKIAYDAGNKTIKIIKGGKSGEKIIFSVKNEGDIYYLSEILVPVDEGKLGKDGIENSVADKIKYCPDAEVLIWKFNLKENTGNGISPKTERIKKLVETLINLKRNIKARDEDLSPKLLLLGLYKDKPYKSYKDKIVLKDEFTEEEYDEIIEKEENGKIVRKVIHKVSKSKKPVFEILKRVDGKIGKDKIWNKVKEELLDKKDGEVEKVYLYHEPEIKVLAEN